MEYFYYFENASLLLRSLDYLYGKSQMPKAIVTVIHQMDGWLVKVKINSPFNSQLDLDLRAYFHEVGIPEEPSRRVNIALMSLEAGESPIDIMRRYQIVVVFHGHLEQKEIHALQQLLL